VHVDSLDQPGRYFIYQPERPDGFTEIIRRASWLPATAAHSTTPFAFETSAGVRLSGWLTLPRHQPLSSAPLVVYCHNLPGGRPEPWLNTEVHALARMGFAVARIHYRGTAGLGRKHQEAIKAGIDTVPIADIRAAAAWLAANKNINPRRVALLGQGFGGYLAARALQLHPEEFRCAIAINAPPDLARWMQDRGNASAPPPALVERQAFFDHPHTPLSAISLTREPELFRRPVFLLQDVERRDLGEAHGRRLLEALRKRRIEAQYLAL